MQKGIYQQEKITFNTTEKYDSVRVFVWEDIAGLTPVTSREIVK